MLVLSRKEDESISIVHVASGDEVLVMLTDISECQKKVRIGFEADRAKFRILRTEIIGREVVG